MMPAGGDGGRHAPTFRYRAYGLVFEAAQPIPALATSDLPRALPADVTILEDAVAAPGPAPGFIDLEVHVDGADCIVTVAECGRFSVRGGREIRFEREPGVSLEQVHVYLLGSVMGALLYQRGLLPIHCNGVGIDGRAILFCGDSGAGKSTLAAYLGERGLALLTDDVCALRREADDRLVALPGVARLKVWRDALNHLGLDAAAGRPVPWTTAKYELPMGGNLAANALPLGAIYHLRYADDAGLPAGIHRLEGLAAVNAVTANIYRRRLADLLGLTPRYLALAVRIAREVPVFSFNRRAGLEHFGDEAEGVLRHVAALPPSPSPCDSPGGS